MATQIGRPNIITTGKLTEVEYVMLHKWVKRQLGRPSVCENCGTTDAKQFDWANISGNYLKDISDWARLCKSCHSLIDKGISTTCGRGHPWTPDNMFNRKNGRRDCKTCRRFRHLQDKGVMSYV